MPTINIHWTTGTGNILLTYTGQGNGTIQVSSDPNNLGSVRSQTITVETTQGGVIIKNLTITQAACPIPVGTILNYNYTGNYQEVTLPAGSYKLQCWGAQGGSNAAYSSYSITAQAGGKGGYSEGILTLTSPTKVRIYVGGQGSSSAGGFNGGGSTTGTSQYNSNNELGYSKMGGGGGATDIRLSDGALLSRMIVAGGGSGGAMCYKSVTTTTTSWETKYTRTITGYSYIAGNGYFTCSFPYTTAAGNILGGKYRITITSDKTFESFIAYYKDSNSGTTYQNTGYKTSSPQTFDITYNANANQIWIGVYYPPSGEAPTGNTTVKIEYQTSTSTTTTSNSSSEGKVGGGTTGGGSSTYQGKQNAAGSGGSFGQGANMTSTNYRYCAGAGGGGWYGGGCDKNDNTPSYVENSGGGSGFVNIAANASYRPSGYTGLQLDSGSTIDGNSAMPTVNGTGTKYGQEGNGYARITRLS